MHINTVEHNCYLYSKLTVNRKVKENKTAFEVPEKENYRHNRTINDLHPERMHRKL